MATPNISDEEIQFRKRARRRLVGAIVLVMLVVVVVPWILPADKPPQEAQEIDIRIPARDASGFAPKVVPAEPAVAAKPPGNTEAVAPAPAPSAQDGGKSMAPADTQAKSPAKAAAVNGEPVPQAKLQESKPAAPQARETRTPEPTAAAAAAPAGERYYVQFGAFSSEKNAAQKQAEVKAKGIQTFTEVVKTPAGDKIRVRSGPYPTRALAEQIQQKAKPLESKLVPVAANGKT